MIANMLDIKFIRENADAVRAAAKNKNIDPALVDDLLKADAARRTAMAAAEAIRAEQKKANDREAGATLKERFRAEEEKLKPLEKRYEELMAKMPTVPSPDTPVGAGDEDNKEIFRWVPKDRQDGHGGIAPFGFAPKDHMELGTALDILDFERGTKVGGFRGYYVKNDGVLLEMGIMMYALNKMVEKGYAPMIPPTLVKGFALFGSGYFKGLEYDPEVDEIYQIATSDKEAGGEASKDKKFLVGTAEPSLLAYYSDQVLAEGDLPVKNSGYSQCYRSEIGSYGKDTKGMYRVHEFMKVEQVVVAPADVDMMNTLQDEMTGISGEMHEELGLPYRRLQICTGDMSAGKYRAFDLEAWLPGMNRWAETGSASSFGDWQSRRLNIKYVDKSGERKYAYLLNNTALPSPRVFIAILENYQTADGKVMVPEVLQKYVGKKVIG